VWVSKALGCRVGVFGAGVWDSAKQGGLNNTCQTSEFVYIMSVWQQRLYKETTT